jgi:hypothetical protein
VRAWWTTLGLGRLVAGRSLWAATLFFGLLTSPGALSAGECVDAMNAPEIIRQLSCVDPDSVPYDARYLLGCLDHHVGFLEARPGSGNLPSWRLLRNTRRLYRDFGRNPELVAVLKRMFTSKDPFVRSSAAGALALYGQGGYSDSLTVAGASSLEAIMLLAVVGDTTGARLAIDAYPGSRVKLILLDALYYQSTPAAVDFIARVAQDSSDQAAADRARWMLENPMPVEASWKL